MCGCLCCSGNCERNAKAQRIQAVGFLLGQWKVTPEERPAYRKAFSENPDLVDCIILLQRLNYIKRNETDFKKNRRHYSLARRPH